MRTTLKPQPIGADRRAGIRRASDHQIKLMRLDEVLAVCALGRTSLYEAIRDGAFPAPISIYGRTRRWVNQEIQEWLLAQIAAQHVS